MTAQRIPSGPASTSRLFGENRGLKGSELSWGRFEREWWANSGFFIGSKTFQRWLGNQHHTCIPDKEVSLTFSETIDRSARMYDIHGVTFSPRILLLGAAPPVATSMVFLYQQVNM